MPLPRLPALAITVVLALVSIVKVGVARADDTRRSIDDAAVEAAITTFRDALYALQDGKTGGWYTTWDTSPALNAPKYDGGLTALATLALLYAGDTPQSDPRLARAVERLAWLQDNHAGDVVGTYSVGVRAQVWAKLPDDYLPRLERDAEQILGGLGKGGHFGYLLNEPPAADDNYNHSTTQYGALGLWAAASRGVRVPDKAWTALAEHFLRTQRADGGWGYSPSKPSTVSMACAGITVLNAASQSLDRGRADARDPVREAVERGLAFIDNQYQTSLRSHANGGHAPYAYAVERIGLASGEIAFAGTPWYDDLGGYILERARGATLERPVACAMYLMFLTRGRVPVAVSKLQLDGQAWNQRPNDVYYMADRLSRTFEREVAWQSLPLSPADGEAATADALGVAPLAFISVAGPLRLNAAETERLRGYLEQGGLLVVNAEKPSAAFDRSVEQVVADVWPGAVVDDLPPAHPVRSLWKPLSDKARVRRVHTGGRDLMIIPRQDWGLAWQRGRASRLATGAAAHDPFRAAANLFLFAADHGRIEGRTAAADPPEVPAGPEPTHRVRVWQPAGPQREPRLWSRLRRALHAADPEVVVAVERVEAPDAGEPGSGLLHLAGFAVEDADAAAAADAAVAHAGAGGTVLVETLGGRGGFAAAVEAALVERLGISAQRVAADDPAVADITFGYRLQTQEELGDPSGARLLVMEAPGGGRVYLSGEDLSYAAMRVMHWGYSGYDAATSEAVLGRLLGVE